MMGGKQDNDYILNKCTVTHPDLGQVRIRWLYVTDPEQARDEQMLVAMAPVVDDDGNEDESVEECPAWQADCAAAETLIWPAVRDAVRHRVAVPERATYVSILRSDKEGAAALLTWSWERQSDGSDPTILAVVPTEMVRHLPCSVCDFLCARRNPDEPLQ